VVQLRVNSRAEGAEFDAVYKRDFGQLVRLAHLLTGSNAAAEDIVQEAFFQLHRRFATVANAGGYLRVSVVNLCKNWNRGQAREAHRTGRLEPNVQTGPHDVDEVLAIVDGLPFKQRAVLVARYWLDLPEAAIAELVGCRRGTVKSLTSRALTTLREKLQ
jgi:RNA polymerase sigma factor (sigma-70 family)